MCGREAYGDAVFLNSVVVLEAEYLHSFALEGQVCNMLVFLK